jgi:hypothetical protein
VTTAPLGWKKVAGPVVGTIVARGQAAPRGRSALGLRSSPPDTMSFRFARMKDGT